MSSNARTPTGDEQHQKAVRRGKGRSVERLGLMTSRAYVDDPKRLAFTLSRYKFAAKMLAGLDHVLEVGCGDAFATRVVAQEVGKITAIEFDASFIKDARSRHPERWGITCVLHDVLEGPPPGDFDGAYSLAGLGHVPAEAEDRFLSNMIAPVRRYGTVIVGMPAPQPQAHTSAQSREGPINRRDQGDFRALMQRYFHNVFMFSMNDEVVHTGYHAMSHYNIALCCGRKAGLP